MANIRVYTPCTEEFMRGSIWGPPGHQSEWTSKTLLLFTLDPMGLFAQIQMDGAIQSRVNYVSIAIKFMRHGWC